MNCVRSSTARAITSKSDGVGDLLHQSHKVGDRAKPSEENVTRMPCTNVLFVARLGLGLLGANAHDEEDSVKVWWAESAKSPTTTKKRLGVRYCMTSSMPLKFEAAALQHMA